MASFYCLKAYKREGLSENHQIWAAYFMDGRFAKFIYGHVAMLSAEIEIWYWILYKFYPVRSFHYS